MKNICVFCSSSSVVDESYFDVTEKIGKLLGQKNKTLIYGGANIGLMGHLAKTVKDNKGKVIGVIPEVIKDLNIVYEQSDEIIVTSNLRTRKQKMDELAEAFIALPGGFGTLEELLEIITLKQLEVHNRPIVILNTNKFFENLLEMFKTIYIQKFSREVCDKLYYITSDPEKALEYIDNYIPVNIGKKW